MLRSLPGLRVLELQLVLVVCLHMLLSRCRMAKEMLRCLPGLRVLQLRRFIGHTCTHVWVQDGPGDAALPAGAAGAGAAGVQRRGGRLRPHHRHCCPAAGAAGARLQCMCSCKPSNIKEGDTGWSAHLLMEVPAAELPDCGPCSTRQRCSGRCECCVATVWPGIRASSLQ
jgi:hypothetical protein